MQAVLTVVGDKQTDLATAADLGAKLVAQGRIADVRLALSPRGLSFILNPDTTAADRQEIIGEIKALGFTVVEQT